MSFDEQLPRWDEVGVEPSESKKTSGWAPGDKPPADYFNWLFNRIYKSLQEIFSKAAEKTDVDAHINATTVHGSTSAATANKIMQRDGSGRAKVAAPSASDDIAIKSTVDAVQSNLTTHKTAAILDHPDASVTDAKIGTRTIDDTVTAATGADTPTALWSKLGNIIKQITGGATWYAAPVSTISALFGKFHATTGHGHTGATSDGPKITSSGLANDAATDTIIGNRTITDTVTAATGADTPTNLFSKLGNIVKQISGGANWYTAPVSTIVALFAKFHATTGHGHTGATSDGPKIAAAGLANGAATDTIIGTRTIVDTTTATSGADTPTNLWSKLGNMIKAITGKSNWYTAPVTTIEALNTALGLKANKAQQAWITPTLLNGWVNEGGGTWRNLQYFKDDFGIVHVVGAIKSGSLTTVFMQLPVGYRPSGAGISTIIPTESSDGFARIAIFSDGNLQMASANGTGTIYFVNISFLAEQ